MHEAYLRQAIDLAAANVESGEGGPFGALIVKDGNVIARSGNKVTSMLDPTAHAEILAIRSACSAVNDFQLTGCILYTNCEPCPMCLGAIYWARLASVYFACTRDDAARVNFDDSFIYDEIALLPQQRTIPMRQVNMENSLFPFTLWNSKTDKIPY